MDGNAVENGLANDELARCTTNRYWFVAYLSGIEVMGRDVTLPMILTLVIILLSGGRLANLANTAKGVGNRG